MSSARFSDLQEGVERNLSNLKESTQALRSSSKDGARLINAECVELTRRSKSREGAYPPLVLTSASFAIVDADIRLMEEEKKKATPAVRRSQEGVIMQLKTDMSEARSALQRQNDVMHRAELLPSRSSEVGFDLRSKAWGRIHSAYHYELSCDTLITFPLQQDTALLAGARDKMVATATAASQGTQKLQQTVALLDQTTTIGVTTLDTLMEQRKQIENTTGRVRARAERFSGGALLCHVARRPTRAGCRNQHADAHGQEHSYGHAAEGDGEQGSAE